ncbi:unnamed protein product [Amoebophrya sp. A25]|nr:unnamed protein product [Amoebophrya sp. A25]|eukprot:GSA25T00016643001.1
MSLNTLLKKHMGFSLGEDGEGSQQNEKIEKASSSTRTLVKNAKEEETSDEAVEILLEPQPPTRKGIDFLKIDAQGYDVDVVGSLLANTPQHQMVRRIFSKTHMRSDCMLLDESLRFRRVMYEMPAKTSSIGSTLLVRPLSGSSSSGRSSALTSTALSTAERQEQRSDFMFEIADETRSILEHGVKALQVEVTADMCSIPYSYAPRCSQATFILEALNFTSLPDDQCQHLLSTDRHKFCASDFIVWQRKFLRKSDMSSRISDAYAEEETQAKQRLMALAAASKKPLRAGTNLRDNLSLAVLQRTILAPPPRKTREVAPEQQQVESSEGGEDRSRGVIKASSEEQKRSRPKEAGSKKVGSVLFRGRLQVLDRFPIPVPQGTQILDLRIDCGLRKLGYPLLSTSTSLPDEDQDSISTTPATSTIILSLESSWRSYLQLLALPWDLEEQAFRRNILDRETDPQKKAAMLKSSRLMHNRASRERTSSLGSLDLHRENHLALPLDFWRFVQEHLRLLTGKDQEAEDERTQDSGAGKVEETILDDVTNTSDEQSQFVFSDMNSFLRGFFEFSVSSNEELAQVARRGFDKVVIRQCGAIRTNDRKTRGVADAEFFLKAWASGNLSSMLQAASLRQHRTESSEKFYNQTASFEFSNSSSTLFQNFAVEIVEDDHMEIGLVDAATGNQRLQASTVIHENE